MAFTDSAGSAELSPPVSGVHDAQIMGVTIINVAEHETLVMVVISDGLAGVIVFIEDIFATISTSSLAYQSQSSHQPTPTLHSQSNHSST